MNGSEFLEKDVRPPQECIPHGGIIGVPYDKSVSWLTPQGEVHDQLVW
jgi:hypothetical protein